MWLPALQEEHLLVGLVFSELYVLEFMFSYVQSIHYVHPVSVGLYNHLKGS